VCVCVCVMDMHLARISMNKMISFCLFFSPVFFAFLKLLLYIYVCVCVCVCVFVYVCVCATHINHLIEYHHPHHLAVLILRGGRQSFYVLHQFDAQMRQNVAYT